MNLLLRACAVLATVAQLSPASARIDLVEDEEMIVQSWGAAHLDCAEWSDTCVVCRRGTDISACSTPGIACTPTAIACRTPATGPKP